MTNRRRLQREKRLGKNEGRLVVYHSSKNNTESIVSESSRGESFISEEKKNSSRGEYDFAPCSPRRTSVCLHTIIVTLDNHRYTVALYIISMIYLCHYLFVHLTPTSLCHCLHPEEVSCEVNWGYGGQSGSSFHRLWMKCVKLALIAYILSSF